MKEQSDHPDGLHSTPAIIPGQGAERPQGPAAVGEVIPFVTTAQLRTLLEGLPLALVRIDMDGRVQRWNPAAERLFGWRAEEVLGQRLPIVPADQCGAFAKALHAGLRGAWQEGVELQALRKDRPVIDVSLWTTPLLGDQGKLLGHIALFADISARKQAEQGLVARSQQLEAIEMVSAEITREMDLTRLLQLIHRRAVELLGARAGFVLLYDASTQTLIPQAWEGHGEWVTELRFRLGEGIAGKVAKQRRGMVVTDYRTSPYTLPLILAHSSVTAVVAEPLLYRDRLVGVVTVDNHGAEDRDFTESDRDLLALFAGHAAIAIENARLHEAAVRRGDEMAALLGASRAIESSLAFPERLHAIVEQAAAIARAPIVRLFLLEEGDRLLRCTAGVGFPLDVARDLTIPVGESLSGQVAVTGQPLAVADTRVDARPQDPAHVDKYGVVSYLGLPVKFQERLFGVLVFNTPTPRTYAPEEIAFLAAFAQQAAVAIQNARLYDAAQRDLGERRQAEAVLEQRTRQLDTVRTVSAEITRELDLPRLLELITKRAVEMVGASSGILRLWDDTQHLLVTGAWTGVPSQVPTVGLRLGEGVSGEAARRQKALYVNDFRKSPYAISALLDGSVHTAVMAAPLLYRERLVGVLAITRMATDPLFTEAELDTLTLLVPQAAIAIENARLYETAQRELVERSHAEATLVTRTSQMEAIRAVTSEITRELHLPSLLQLITQRAGDLLGGAAGAVFLWDEATQQLIPQGWYGDAHADEHRPRRLGEGLVGAVAARRVGLCVNEYRSSPFAVPYVLAHSDITAALAEPLLYHERVLGVLALNDRGKSRRFTAQDQALLRLFADQAAIAIENARLFQAQQQAYAQLQQAQEEAIRAEKLRALGQMAAGVAHDLNNMLAAILGQAELLRLRVQLPEVQEGLQVLATAASDGAQVVRRLQEFGRQQASTPLAPCALAPIVDEALELTRPRWQDEAQRQGRAIHVTTALAGLPPILGHPAELREALTNLILNAVDALPHGGTLTLAGARDPAPSAGVVLTVTDTGVGMPEAVRRHIFDPFYTTKGIRGTGLGLAVVYGILERHGGRIDVASAPGQGTTFTLRFQAAPPGASPVPGAPPSPAAAPRRLLLIDDESPVRATIAALLRAVGHDVTEAESGAVGLARLAAEPVDLVITDLGMPEMTGWEVAQRVKAAHPALPVVLLTGWGQQLPDPAPGRACVDRVLAKPIRLAELQATIAGFPVPGAAPRHGV